MEVLLSSPKDFLRRQATRTLPFSVKILLAAIALLAIFATVNIIILDAKVLPLTYSDVRRSMTQGVSSSGALVGTQGAVADTVLVPTSMAFTSTSIATVTQTRDLNAAASSSVAAAFLSTYAQALSASQATTTQQAGSASQSAVVVAPTSTSINEAVRSAVALAGASSL